MLRYLKSIDFGIYFIKFFVKYNLPRIDGIAFTFFLFYLISSKLFLINFPF